jgi:hypothetical protein
MKTRHLLVMAVFVVAMSLVSVVPAGACTEGCTPGYWKNHLDAWVGYTPDQTFSGVFGVGPDMNLLDALSAKNKDVGSGVEAALVRHAVAALLNSAHPDVAHREDLAAIQNGVQYAYEEGKFEQVKNVFEEWNELGCPLD